MTFCPEKNKRDSRSWQQRIEPVLDHRLRYRLSELLAQCDSSAAQSDECRAWLDDEPAGRESL